MHAFRKKILHPGNLIVSVAGDFEEAAILDRLEKVMAGWEKGEVSPAAPAPPSEIVPGLYRVEKDIPQGKVNIGIKGIQRDDPDAVALKIMSRILGSSGFTSRITQRVRSDEGLAYSAGARAAPGLYFRGEIRGFFESKNVTVALATKIIFEEFKRIANEAVSDAELETAKAAVIQSFPANFGSKSQILSVLSALAETIVPSGLNTTSDTKAVCPSSMSDCGFSSAFQILHVRSRAPETIFFPSRLKATH